MSSTADPQITGKDSGSPRLSGSHLRLLLLLLFVALIGTCSPPQHTFNQVRQTGVLRVVTVNGPTTYYLSADESPAGFEYDLIEDFAKSMGAEPQIIVAESRDDALSRLRSGAADIAAAGLISTPRRETNFWFSPSIRKVTPQVVYLLGRRRPRSLDEINGELHLPARGSSTEWLSELESEKIPQWTTRTDVDQESLLQEVAAGRIDFTIADSDLVAITRRYHPELRVAFSLHDAAGIAWAVRHGEDPQFREAITRFIAQQRDAGLLARVHDRYFGHVNRLDYVGTRTFARHVQTRLPRLQGAFQAAASRFGFDWRLLAAVGYQESHWNPDAKSPTGVRGIMMLTRATAKGLGVKDRTDPLQSIFGGARYLRKLHDRLPDDIAEPDRTWMALAAYNLGMGHLRDARNLTVRNGGDPNTWPDIREVLPRLAQKHWYKQTAYGYARGHEAVTYVGNIRGYFDILSWISDTEEQQFPVLPRIDDEPPPRGLDPRLTRHNPLL